MKRIAILILSGVVLSLNIYAQKVRFGITADPKLNWVNSMETKVLGNTLLPSINYGLMIERFFTDNYAFSTGLSIDHLSSKIRCTDTFNVKISGKSDSLMPSSTYDIRSNYLKIPLGLKLLTREIGYFRIYADIAFVPEILLRSTIYSKDEKLGDFQKETSLINLSYQFALGIEYSLGGTTSIHAGLIYSNGFSDITRFDDDKVMTNNMGLRLGLIF